ncbi:hypothetical protein B5S30_g5810 [[Candida] boidinii]|nr:hypothetical protein B5S30_g5810 [[Candida] boidinii]
MEISNERSTPNPVAKPVDCKLLKRKAFVKVLESEDVIDMCGFIQVEQPEGLVQEISQVEHILEDYADIITNESPKEMPPRRDISHDIVIYPGALPTYRAQYRLTPEEKVELTKQVGSLLDQGFIRKSTSPYNSPVLFVKKKDGTLRLCIDYRALNNITIKNKFPIPRIDEALDKLGGAKVFSKMDLRSGFYQIRVTDEDVPKTAFSTDRAHYEFTVMPFGLTNAPATFQTMMNTVLGGFIDKFVLVYIDDILIYSKTAEEHEKHIKMVLSKLREHKLVAKKSKCEFFKDKLQFLGFVISKDGIHTDPDKVDRIKNWPTPTSRKQVQSFLGLVGFYRRFIQNHSKISSCLTDYVAKKVEWSKEQDEAFQTLKNKLITSPIVVAPCFDAGHRLRLSTDACDYALGYVLELLNPDGKLVGVVAYGSKKLTGALLNYSIREKEFLAVVEALKKWRYYLMQRKFIIRTDHHSLQYWKQQDAATQTRIAKWNDVLSGFDFDLEYLPGTQNSVADALSRKPLADDDPTFTDEEVAELDSLQVELNDLNATEHTVHMNSDLVPQIVEGYANDTQFATIYDVLANKKPVPVTLNHHITHFSVRDDKLLYFDDSRICIPHIPNVKEKILHLCHDIPMSGHFSSDKTYC